MFKTTKHEIKLVNDWAGRGSLCPRTPHDDDEKLNASLSVACPPAEALADPPPAPAVRILSSRPLSCSRNVENLAQTFWVRLCVSAEVNLAILLP